MYWLVLCIFINRYTVVNNSKKEKMLVTAAPKSQVLMGSVARKEKLKGKMGYGVYRAQGWWRTY